MVAKHGAIDGRMLTSPDVRGLMDRFLARLEPNAEVYYAELRAALSAGTSACSEGRYRTVLTAWRRQLREEHGIELIPVRLGRSFRVATDGDKVGLVTGQVRRAGNCCRRAVEIGAHVNSEALTAASRKELDHAMRRSRQIVDALIFQPRPVSTRALERH